MNSEDQPRKTFNASEPMPPAEPGTTISRHYRRARQDRGAETRAQLIEAALDIFGRTGFEGATTRIIAKEANANLAAIVYHFGSKEALHLAVAEHVGHCIRDSVAPALQAAATPEAVASPEAAKNMLLHLVGTHIDVMLGNADAERWSRFIVREQMQPSAAFDVLYSIMEHAIDIGTRLVATALGRREDEEARLTVLAIFGEVLVFRVAQALVLRRMGWTEITGRERTKIRKIVFRHVEAILAAGAKG